MQDFANARDMAAPEHGSARTCLTIFVAACLLQLHGITDAAETMNQVDKTHARKLHQGEENLKRIVTANCNCTCLVIDPYFEGDTRRNISRLGTQLVKADA